MAEVLFFHHAQGLTEGVVALADELRAAGHTVHTPDLYAGRTFDSLDEGVALAQELGFEKITETGVRAADGLPDALVYAGISLGVPPAQKLAQTRPGARGLLLFAGGFEPTAFGPSWPPEVPVRVYAMADDPEFNNEWDLPAATALVEAAADGEMVLYPGAEHLFMDRSLAAYDAATTAQMTTQVLEFLAAVR